MARGPLLAHPHRPLALFVSLLVASVVASLVASTPASAQRLVEDGEDLCVALTNEALAHEVTLGLVVIDLRDGERCEVNAERTFRSASLYKLVVLAEAYQQAASGALDLDGEITLEPHHAIDDPDELRIEEPVTVTVESAVQEMIQVSDNASALALREALGKPEVQAAAARLGMERTVLGELFVTTPGDIALFFEQLYRGQVVDQASSRAMIDILRGQRVDHLIREGLPADARTIEIAHKTGVVDDVLHDAGIVYAPGGDYVLVAMSEHDEDLATANEAIHDVSSLVYSAFAEPLTAEARRAWPGDLAATLRPEVGAAVANLEPDVADLEAIVARSERPAEPPPDGAPAGQSAGWSYEQGTVTVLLAPLAALGAAILLFARRESSGNGRLGTAAPASVDDRGHRSGYHDVTDGQPADRTVEEPMPVERRNAGRNAAGRSAAGRDTTGKQSTSRSRQRRW